MNYINSKKTHSKCNTPQQKSRPDFFLIIIIYVYFYAYILARIHLRMIRICTRISRPKRYRISIPRVALESRLSRLHYLVITTSRGCPEWSVLNESSSHTRMCTCAHYSFRHAFQGSNLSVFSIRKIRCDRDGSYIDIELLFSIEIESTRLHYTQIETTSRNLHLKLKRRVVSITYGFLSLNTQILSHLMVINSD